MIEERPGHITGTRKKEKEKTQPSEEKTRSIAAHLFQSCMLKAPIGAVWDSIKSFEPDKQFPSQVSSCKFISGSPSEIGSMYEVSYKDGSMCQFRIVELSEKRREVSYELVDSKPSTSFTSFNGTIRVQKVTEDNSSFVSWEYDFSNDIDIDSLNMFKNQMSAKLTDFKKLFSTSS